MRWLLVALVLPLTACLDVEADFVLGEDETITADATMTVGRQLYDMMQLAAPQAEAICPPAADKTVGSEVVTCVTRDTTTLTEVIDQAEQAKGQNAFLNDIQVVRLDDETVRVIMPLDFDKIEGRPPELTAENPMFAMMADGLADAELVVRLTALEVIESNGAISEDGTTVELVVPTLELLQPSGNLPPAFTAVLKYRNCGVFGC